MTSRISDNLVHSSVLRWADAEPQRVALFTNGVPITYGALAGRCVSLAGEIDRHHARRVGLCLPNSSAVIEVFLASLMSGACACIFDSSWPIGVIKDLVKCHAPNLMFASSGLLAQLGEAISPEQMVTPELVNEIGSRDQPLSALKSQPTADMPFLLGFTSGSSGTPKGFVRSHQTWIESFRHSAIELGTSADDVVVAPGPLSHGLSLYAAIEALSAGAKVAIHTEFSADTVLETINQVQGTVVVVVPTMLDVLIESADFGSFPSVERIVTAGSKLSPTLRNVSAQVFPNAEVIEYYGASELSFISVAKGSEQVPPGSVGRAFSGVEIAIRDGGGTPVGDGETGTIWIKSHMMSSGYVGPTDGSGFRTEGAWATVGDLGHMDEDGFLYLDGREGSVITSAGYTVYPSAIETALINHPNVADAAVVGVPDARWGEVIGAVVVADNAVTMSEEILTAYCRDSLEPYACPRRWCFVDTLERTPSGKIRRADLLKIFRQPEK